MPSKRTLSSAMLYLGVMLVIVGCGTTTTATTTHIEVAIRKPSSPHPAPSRPVIPVAVARTATLDLTDWRKLQSSLIPTIVLAGGSEAYLRDMREVEEHEVPGSACSTARECLLAIRSTLVQSVVETRGVLGHLQERTLGECAAAMQNASRLLKRWQRVIEATLPQAMASEYLWANSAHELDALEEPEGHLGDGLASCDPNGTGEIEAQE